MAQTANAWEVGEKSPGIVRIEQLCSINFGTQSNAWDAGRWFLTKENRYQIRDKRQQPEFG